MFLKKYFHPLLLALQLLAFFPYLYLSFFTHPAGDDYNFAVLGKVSGFWTQWSNEYYNWNGRYASNILALLNPLTFNSMAFYKIAPVLQMLALLFSFYYFISAQLRHAFSVFSKINVSILFLLLFLFGMPSLSEGIYWYTGAVSYQSGVCIALIYLGLVTDFFYGKYYLHKYFHFLLCSFLILAATGFNEVLTLLLLCFHAGFYFFFRKERNHSVRLVFFALCLCGTLAMFLSPGNSVRSSCFAEKYRLFHSLEFTVLQTLRFSFDWISSLPVIFSSLLLSLVVANHREMFFHFNNYKLSNPAVPVTMLAGILFTCLFPPYWATDILGQHRTVNAACLFFLLVLLAGVIAFSLHHAEKIRTLFPYSAKFIFLLLLLIFFSITFTKNGYNSCLDIFYGTAKKFDKEMSARYELLNNANNKGKIIHLKPLQSKPASLFVLDLSDDSTFWGNISQAKYFGVRAIVCRK